LSDHVLDRGPYIVTETSDTRLRLERRSSSLGIDCIDVSSYGSTDAAWRRMMAGDIDLLNTVPAAATNRLREIPSLRVEPMAKSTVVGIWFNMRGPLSSHPEVRRAVSLGLRRSPLASVITGDASLAEPVAENIEASRRFAVEAGLSGKRLTLIVASGEAELQRTAMIVEQQLAALGIEMNIVPVSIDEMSERVASGDFDLSLHFVGWRPDQWESLQQIAEFLGYETSAFKAAVAANDESAVRAVLEADVPVTPLYRLPEGVVISRAFCNARPIVAHDLSWLKDVRPCAAGEVD
jgi:peptide/nickel transport system substrate-binding protein